MGGDILGNPGRTAGIDSTEVAAQQPPVSRVPDKSPAWDRFADWPQLQARVALFTLLLMMAMAAMVPIKAGEPKIAAQELSENLAGEQSAKPRRDDDLALYDVAVDRIRGGEHYYDFIVSEQRIAQFPVRPGVAVRLPTLVYLNAYLGTQGQTIAAVLLLMAVMIVWWRRLGEEPGGREHRTMAIALLFVGASLGLNRYFFQLHELWAGMLLALAFGLHRPGKWGAALAVAALAVAIREHALPFIMLMAAMAAWRRDWKETAAWSALTLVFLTALALHLGIIAQQVTPDDRYGQGWMTLRGLSGWLSNITLSSNLRHLPHWLAGPAIILMVFGWCAWRTSAGLFGTFLFLGYGLAFMIAGRGDNYYWGAVVAPPMMIGLAFAPRGIASLIKATRRKPHQSNCV